MTQLPQWSAFDPTNAIGDPGRQPEIRPTSGPLNVGVPDTALDFLAVDPFEIRACSSRGWSHRYQGTPRQDSYSLLVNEDLVVVAVADGVSEGEYSQVAAETAARSACKLVADQMAKSGSIDWVRLGRRVSLRIIDEAEYRRISVPADPDPTSDERLRACLDVMSSTLILAVIDRTPTHEGYLAQIGVVAGDSAAYLLRDGALLPTGGGKDESGAISSTQVRPLPGAVVPMVGAIHLLPGQALILGTDGLGDPLGDGTGEVGRELAFRWKTPPTIDQFLLDVNAYRRSFDDDRTAVGVWLRTDAALPEELPPSELSDGNTSDGQASYAPAFPPQDPDAEPDSTVVGVGQDFSGLVRSSDGPSVLGPPTEVAEATPGLVADRQSDGPAGLAHDEQLIEVKPASPAGFEPLDEGGDDGAREDSATWGGTP